MITTLLLTMAIVKTTSEIPEAYQHIASKHRIPVEVFYAMILQESGENRNGRFIPWPWTLNVEHKPYRYETREEAESALREFLNTDKPIAVGLGQIYLPAHGHLFEDPAVLLSPKVNLDYAASLLSMEFNYLLKMKKPNWWLAAGRYHHPSNEQYASIYRALVFLKCRRISTQCQSYGKIQ